jgi:hypothetical protein
MSISRGSIFGAFGVESPIVEVLTRLRFPNSMDGNVVIPLSEFMDVTLHTPVSRVLLSRNGLDKVVRADRHGLGSV